MGRKRKRVGATVLELILFQSERGPEFMDPYVYATLAEAGVGDVLAVVRDVGEVLNGGLARLEHGERPAVLLLVGDGERALGRDGSGGY
jgi:hypothetical protein